MSLEDLEEIKSSEAAKVAVEFEFEENNIKVPEFFSTTLDQMSMEENEQLVYKFQNDLKLKLKIHLVSKEGKKFVSSNAIVIPYGNFKINYSDNGKLMADGKYASDNAETHCVFYYGNSATKRLEANYVEGKKNGLIKEYYQNGLIKSTGNYLFGNKHDKKFQEFNESGELSFFGVYEHGKRITNLCEWVETEYKQDLDDDINNLKNCIKHFDRGNRDPKKMLITKYDKRKLESVEYWNCEKKHSTGILLHENGYIKYNGRLVNGQPHGDLVKLYYDNGKLMYKGKMVQGKQNGTGELYHPNGVLKYKGQFLDNVFHGDDCSIYHNNYEQKYRGVIDKGNITGENVKLYQDNGKIDFFGRIINGVKIYGKLYHENGNLRYDGLQQNNGVIGNGHVKIYHDNGNLYYDGFFKNGMKNGHGKEFHYNGVLKYEGNFCNDKIDAENVTIYFDTGQFYYIGKVRNGLFQDKGKISLYKSGEANDTHKKTLNPEYKDGLLHNSDTKIAYMSPGNVFRYNGDFKNGKKEGNGSLYNVGEWDDSIEKYNTFTIYEGEWKDDLPYGDDIVLNKMFHPDKKHFKGNFKRAENGSLYGECELYNMRQQILFRGKYKAPCLTSIISGSWEMELEPFEEQTIRLF